MPTTSMVIPVPGSGFGAAVSVAALDQDKLFVASGPAGAIVVIEGSTDGGVSFAPVASFEIFPNPTAVPISLTLTHIRAKNLTLFGPVSLSVGAEVVSVANVFSSIPVSLVAPGVSADTSALGERKAVLITGEYTGVVVLEGSQDGSSFNAIASFGTGQADAVVIVGILQRMRATLIQGVGSPSVSVGAPAPGGGGGGSDEQVKVTAADTTANYLDPKVAVVAGELTKAVLSPGGNEQLELGLPSVGPGPIVIGGGIQVVHAITLDANGRVTAASAVVPFAGNDEKVKVTAADTTEDFLDSKVSVIAGELTKAVLNPGADEELQLGLPDAGPGAGTIGGGASFVNSVTLDTEGRVTAATAAVPAGGGNSGTWEATYTAEAKSELVLTDGEFQSDFEDFTNPNAGVGGNMFGFSTLGSVADTIGGVTSFANNVWDGGSGNPSIINNSAFKFYMAIRIRYVGTEGAGKHFWSGFAKSDLATAIILGYQEDDEAGKYIALLYNGAGSEHVVLGDMDTDWHNIRMWGKDVLGVRHIFFKFDNSAIIDLVPTFFDLNTFMNTAIRSGTGTFPDVHLDKMLVVTELPM